jgi:adenylate kinase
VLNGVIAMMVDPEQLIARITARRTCSTCNTIVNLSLDPLNSFSRCPACGGELVHRDDDNETVVRMRIEEYHEATEPLLEYYKNKGQLYAIEGLGTVNEVGMRIAEVLDQLDSSGRVKHA